ncbi:DUF4013 domain-containing protein [Halocatena salina]|uniref:DUF4013 domain-containing protein n=1 Tax=Halocatena salina TaxID=2934340 RepID=A0A8U0A1W0_9EURY|nr:DUF4013 domain-containing protein [Halocatena salina]UPM42023.1 DUF4013 domain-containing protein [Halocatena salina]
MIGDAIKYPTQHDDWIKIILIGGGLYVFSMIPLIGMIGGLLLSGYYVRTLRAAAMEEETPPVFDEWTEMLIDGITYVGIALVYLLIPTILSVILLLIAGGDSLVGLLMTAVLVLVAVYLLPVALTNFAVTDSVDKAFDLSTISDAAFTSEYFTAVVLAVVVGFALSLIGTISILLLVGILIIFYMNVVVHYILGKGCGPQLQQKNEKRITP